MDNSIKETDRTTEAPASVVSGAGFGVLDPHRQQVQYLDATPDEEYPLRILKAYREQCDCHMVTTPPEMGDMMNQWQDERAKILDRAIALLSSPNTKVRDTGDGDLTQPPTVSKNE